MEKTKGRRNEKRYYVDYSSVFTTHLPYDKSQIAMIVKRADGRNVRYALLHGWSNQPHCSVF